MCGITGLWSTRHDGEADLAATVARMTSALDHRGPDDRGHWTDADRGIALGHTRLSIIDLSAAGHQPMHSAGQRFVLVFNGEVYNHAELRAALDKEGGAPSWRGHSDTETLLACMERWGLEKTLQRSVGMFALAAWDRRERCLHLARDRFGEKPLYYGWADGAFVFGSELKALRQHHGLGRRVSLDALADYLRFMYVPAPRSIYEGVYKLEPGCLLTLRGHPPAQPPAMAPAAPATHGSLSVSRWWSLADTIQHADSLAPLDDVAAIDLLERQLCESVKMQSLADVPLGAFLSGGVDSSAIVALMQKQSSRRVQTFTVGFEEDGYDESLHARAVASHLGTDHHELRVTSAEARGVIPHLPRMYDEPFADSSQIPTHLVCRAARSQVTVALSGDAGDELFGGYNRYLWAPRIWSKVGRLPHPARQVLATSMRLAASLGEHPMARFATPARSREKLHKLGTAMHGVRSVDGLYDNLVSCWPQPGAVLAQVPPGPPRATGPIPRNVAGDARARMMYWDTIGYLPDDILCKVDRAAMAIGLETRVPFLDHRVAELAWRLPQHMKIRGGETKWALRQVLYRHVPRALIERPKSGFAIPLAAWLRGPLRNWAEDLLDTQSLRAGGYFQPQGVRSAWQEHLSGSRDWSQRLWCILMFQAWSAADASPGGSA
ncbi:MAG TPA: asparagine synthase (glutamine-hydrolyzing) [Ramlibacter sp.]|uniref:asparagine synthase (glutamine-hydrolyzing) n=1 Tax=Ramlibacter sp. TaxID=1917967 RepID=UPI002ED67001